MKLTLESDYALRIILTLAEANKKLDAKEISEKSVVPHPFTLKILRKLMSSKMVISDRGAFGGYKLSKAPIDISLFEIILAIEEDMDFSRCKDENFICSKMGCEKEKCAFHKYFCGISERIKQDLSSKNIDDILKESKKLNF